MRLFLSILMFSFILASCSESQPKASSDVTVYLGGKIYTGNDANPDVEAVVVEGNRITYVGAAAEARSMGGRIVDLGGAVMFPGFTDSHFHLAWVGERELTLNLEGAPSIAAVVDMLADEIAKSKPGDIITGMSWIETHWPEGRFPTRQDIDPISPDNPVVLRRADGHAVLANTKMLEMAGITRDTIAPEGGEIEKDEAGEITGILVDKAMILLNSVMAAAMPSPERFTKMYEEGGRVYNAYGWTGGHSMSVLPENISLIEELADSGRLSLRVYNSISGSSPDVNNIFDKGPTTSDNGLIVTRAIKMYVDGSLGSRGALMFEPYLDGEGTGLALTSKADMMLLMVPALRKGIQMNIHAIGDRGNRVLLDWIEEAYQAVPSEDRAIENPRWRNEHAQHVSSVDVSRFIDLGVIPSMQPSHAIGDLYFAPDRIGMDRLKEAYAWKPFLDAGSIIVGGSDAPVERGDPRIEFYAAVARKDLQGNSFEGWHPEHAVTRSEALKMFTIWPAYASFRENELGTIEVGKLADFTVFSGDIMTIPEAEILKVDVVMTVVDGQVVYQKHE